MMATDAPLAPLPMLRRSHDHHRGLRARRNATASAVISNHRSQDRYLMSAILSSQIQTTDRSRRSSIRQGGARPNALLRPQRGHRSSWLKADLPHLRRANHARKRRPPTRSMASLTITHLGRRAQISIAPAAPPPPRPAVSFLGGFRTPAPLSVFVGTSVIGRHPKPFT